MNSREDLERMRKEAQAKRLAEGGKLPTDEIFNNKRSFFAAFKPSNVSDIYSSVSATDDSAEPHAKIALVSVMPSTCLSCRNTLKDGPEEKPAAAVAAVADSDSVSGAAELSYDNPSIGQSMKVSDDIWASMTPRKLDDEEPADICEIDERMVSAWKRKHFYGLDHDGTPVKDTCSCGLMKSCCLALSRMVARHDRIHLRLSKKYPTKK